MLRGGTRGSASLLGLYGWDGTGTPALLGDTYDGRFGKTGNYVPAMYSRHSQNQICPGGSVIPLFSVAPAGRFQLYFDSFRDEPGNIHSETDRWHFTGSASVGPTAVATSATIQGKHLAALHTTDTTYYGITAETPSRVWSSSAGAVWTQGSAISGMPDFEQGAWAKCFEFAGDVFCFRNFGLYRNAANDLAAWAAIPLLIGYESVCYHDVSFDGTAIVVMCQGRQSGTLYNVILRSTDGTTFTEVRKVEQALDVPAGFAFDLEWRQMCAFGTGFCIYGCNPFAGAAPYVLKSTDHGATWTMSAVSPGGLANLAVANCSGYAGASKVVASIPVTLAGIGPYEQLHSSADGITFAPLSF